MKLQEFIKQGTFCVAIFLVAGALVAQDPPQAAAGDPAGYPPANGAPAMDPPGRVARLNYTNGNVSLRADNVPDWAPASLNFPLTTGYHLWTDQGSHAELHIGTTAIRLADETALAILNLDDRVTQLSLTQGALNVRVASLNPGETLEVDSPNGAVTIERAGAYRFDVNNDGTMSVLTVRAGAASVATGGQSVEVNANQRVHYSGDQETPDVVAAPAPDPWDQWCSGRDTNDDRAVQASARYVPPDMNGAADLGGYGNWRSDPMYGNMWVPTAVAPGWAPYRFGHWAYIPPWGWTWIDDAPWGFAPFHYGRWVIVAGTWAWVPGRIVHPVYAPALVAFVGGPGFGVGIGLGGMGFAAWIPLGPFEVFHPAYRVSAVYVTNVNVAHVTNINVTNVTYVNRSFVTAVPAATFTGARPVAASAVRVPPEAIGRMQPTAVNNLRPSREAMAGTTIAAGARVSAPPASVASRGIVARTPLPSGSQSAGQTRLVTNAPTGAGGGNGFNRPAINDRPPAARGGGSTGGQPSNSMMPNRPANTTPATQPQPQRPANLTTPQQQRPPQRPTLQPQHQASRPAPVQQRTPPKNEPKGRPGGEKKP